MNRDWAVSMFACLCGFHAEGVGEPPACRACGGAMYQWRTRSARFFGASVEAASADKRTANGGYDG